MEPLKYTILVVDDLSMSLPFDYIKMISDSELLKRMGGEKNVDEDIHSLVKELEITLKKS